MLSCHGHAKISPPKSQWRDACFVVRKWPVRSRPGAPGPRGVNGDAPDLYPGEGGSIPPVGSGEWYGPSGPVSPRNDITASRGRKTLDRPWSPSEMWAWARRWPRRLTVRRSAFQADNAGSIPVGVTGSQRFRPPLPARAREARTLRATSSSCGASCGWGCTSA